MPNGTSRTIAALQQFVRYWSNNGHRKIDATMSIIQLVSIAELPINDIFERSSALEALYLVKHSGGKYPRLEITRIVRCNRHSWMRP